MFKKAINHICQLLQRKAKDEKNMQSLVEQIPTFLQVVVYWQVEEGKKLPAKTLGSVPPEAACSFHLSAIIGRRNYLVNSLFNIVGCYKTKSSTHL